MAKVLTDLGASLEAAKMSFQCRKFTPRPPRKCKELNAIVYAFKLSIHGTARIDKELSPKKCRLNKASSLDVGDTLEAQVISGITTKMWSGPDVAPATGSHKGSFITTRDYGYAIIEIPVRELLTMVRSLP